MADGDITGVTPNFTQGLKNNGVEQFIDSISVNNAASPYTVLTTAGRYFNVDTSAGAVTINLPAVGTDVGRLYTINVTDATNSTTITPNIDGASKVLDAVGGITVYSDGTAYRTTAGTGSGSGALFDFITLEDQYTTEGGNQGMMHSASPAANSAFYFKSLVQNNYYTVHFMLGFNNNGGAINQIEIKPRKGLTTGDTELANAIISNTDNNSYTSSVRYTRTTTFTFLCDWAGGNLGFDLTSGNGANRINGKDTTNTAATQATIIDRGTTLGGFAGT